MKRWRCNVIAATSSGEALGTANSSADKLDLQIVDYHLPENIPGIETSKLIQQNLGYSVKVLNITGDTGPERLREA